MKEELEKVRRQIWEKERALESGNNSLVEKNGNLIQMERELRGSEQDAQLFAEYLKEYRNPRYGKLLEETEKL